MVGHHDYMETELAIEKKDYLIQLPAGSEKTYQFKISIIPDEGVAALR